MQDDTHTTHHTHQVATNDKPRRKKVQGPNPLSVKKAITNGSNVEGLARRVNANIGSGVEVEGHGVGRN